MKGIRMRPLPCRLLATIWPVSCPNNTNFAIIGVEKGHALLRAVKLSRGLAITMFSLLGIGVAAVAL